MSIKEDILSFTTGEIKNYFEKIDENVYEKSEEIRIRAERAITFKIKNQFFNSFNNINTYYPSQKDIAMVMEIISGYSLYAFNEEIKNGFISVKGGYRIGIGGKVILNEGKIADIRNITSLNIRIAREVQGCGNNILPYIMDKKGVKNTMIISPPACGKTTLLRDLIRLIGNKDINITVIDERREICNGKIDYGENTDILDGCPKALGMRMALRSMAPNVIAVDEIGSREDADAIWEMSLSGVGVLCTAHGNTANDILNKKELENLVNKKLIERFIFLENKDKIIGKVKTILDENLNDISVKEV